MTKTIRVLNIPNTDENETKVRQAVSQFMVEQVLTKDEIMELAMSHLEETYAVAKHTIGDLARMVKETEIPSQINFDGTEGPSQPNHMLCYGSIPGYTGNGPEYYFFNKEQDYEYSAMEVKETTSTVPPLVLKKGVQ